MVGARFEDIVEELLASMGFEIVGKRSEVNIRGVRVAEVDLIARKDGEVWAVEAKAGKVDVSGIRQAYVNAKVLGARPLVVCRGFSDESARVLADALGVSVMLLPEYVYVSLEELESVVSMGLIRALNALLAFIGSVSRRPKVVEAFVKCEDFGCFCEEVDNCMDVMKELTRGTPIKGASYTFMRLLASIAAGVSALLREGHKREDH